VWDSDSSLSHEVAMAFQSGLCMWWRVFPSGLACTWMRVCRCEGTEMWACVCVCVCVWNCRWKRVSFWWPANLSGILCVLVMTYRCVTRCMQRRDSRVSADVSVCVCVCVCPSWWCCVCVCAVASVCVEVESKCSVRWCELVAC